MQRQTLALLLASDERLHPVLAASEPVARKCGAPTATLQHRANGVDHQAHHPQSCVLILVHVLIIVLERRPEVALALGERVRVQRLQQPRQACGNGEVPEACGRELYHDFVGQMRRHRVEDQKWPIEALGLRGSCSSEVQLAS